MTKEDISLETCLQALFTSWPATIPVFLKHHMSCVGCSMSPFDTLAEATVNYHLEWTSFKSELLAAIGSGEES